MFTSPRLQHVLASVALLLLAACAGGSHDETPRPDGRFAELAGSDAATILALHPYPWEMEDAVGEFESFHGYRILGSAPLEAVDERDLLLDLIERGAEESDGSVAACFNPRHGIHVEKDGSVTDFVICFECLSMNVYVDGAEVDGPLTAERHEPQVTALYKRHGLQIHRDE